MYVLLTIGIEVLSNKGSEIEKYDPALSGVFDSKEKDKFEFSPDNSGEKDNVEVGNLT